MKHLVVLEIVQQRGGNGVGRGGKEDRRSRARDGRMRRRLDEDRERKRNFASRARISWRPLAQVVSTVKLIAAMSSGNQPPSGILVMFEAK